MDSFCFVAENLGIADQEYDQAQEYRQAQEYCQDQGFDQAVGYVQVCQGKENQSSPICVDDRAGVRVSSPSMDSLHLSRVSLLSQSRVLIAFATGYHGSLHLELLRG